MMMGGKIVLGLVLFCYLSVVIAADASRPLGDFTKRLPRKKFPVDDANNFDANDLLDYILSLVYVVAPGFAIGLLSVVVGVIYGLIKLCCCLCCKNRDDDDDEDEESHKSRHKRYGFMSRMIPSVIYILFICWIFAGCVIGWTSNGKMTNGVTTLSNAVSGVGSDALALGDSLLSNLHDIGDAIPQSFNDLLAQISGLPDISKRVVTLGNEVNSTQDDVTQITNQIRAINLNLTVLQDLDKQLRDITSQSKSVIGNVTELIDQVSDKLNNVLNDTIGNMNERLNEVETAIDDIIDQSNSFVGEAENMVKNIDGYVDQVKGYNKQRDSGLSAVYAVSFVTTIVGVLGWFFKKGLPFHVTAGFGFFFCFLFWISGSVHLLLGLVLSDVCPVVDPVLRSAIPKDGQAAAAINGCLNDTSLFVSLQLTDSFNLSEVFDYRSTFNQFTNFVDEFNFTEIDSYLVSINGLYNYNLTTAAQNLTAANLGWDQKYVYDALDALNNQTKPDHVFSVHNYTELDLSDYNPQQRRDRINETYYVLDGLVKANATVYIELDTARTQMIATQHAIEALVHKIDGYSDDFDVLQTNVTDLSTKNVTNAIGIIQALEARVDHFFTLGDCSFVGRGYRAIMSSLCDTMQPADEMLAGSQYMIGLGLIAVIVLVEVLAVRVKYPDNSVDKYGDEKYDYNDDKNNSNSVSMSVQQDRNNNSNNY